MGRIWTFGDSYTAPYAPYPNSNDWRNKYCDWKGYVPKVYGDVISETLGMPLNNLGRGGTDNRCILDSIIDSLNFIKINCSIFWINLIYGNSSNRSVCPIINFIKT